MKRNWLIGLGIVFVGILLITGIVFKRHENGNKRTDRSVSDKIEKRVDQRDSKSFEENEIKKIKEKISQGDFLGAKKLAQNLLDNATSQDTIQRLESLLQEINFKIITNPVPVEGKTVEYKVKPGDTLYGIAKRFGTTVEFIKLRNHLHTNVIRPGQILSIYTGKFSIVVDKSQNLLMLYSDGELVKTYKVSTGKDDKTPEGEFKIVTKLKNPTFFHNGKAIPPGDPDNILGTRWLGLDYGNGSYGIHGTTHPESIGTYETNGCIRMKNEDVEELFALVPIGTPVKVVR